MLAERGRDHATDHPHAVGPELGRGPRPEILAALGHADVEIRLNVQLQSLDREQAVLSDGTVFPTRTVIWTAGMRASALTEGRRSPGPINPSE